MANDIWQAGTYIDQTNQTGGYTKVSTFDLTLDTSAYADGDVLSDLYELTNAVRSSGSTGLITDIVVIDKDKQEGAFDILLFDRSVTTGAKNSADSISDDDAEYQQGIVSVVADNYETMTNYSVAHIRNLNIGINPNTTSLFIATISRDTKTYTADGITLKVTILQD